MEEFNIEKLKLVQTGKEKIRRDLDMKAKKSEVELRISRSTAINKARLQQIEEANQALKKVEQDARARLSAVTKEATKYKAVLVDLIVQGCLALLEDKVTVVCRPEDLSLVNEALKAASTKYSEIIQAANQTTTKTVTLTATSEAKYGGAVKIGGVILCARNGTIRVDNSLETRLNQLLEKDKPAIKKLLFPDK